ncbi:MAG: hypothetical protein KIT41_08060 [Pyrinomonadaceae bacterium]|jgi:hypothetical protein|nr:hypothetical protein [Pyrinomonadaceae bacterium]
MKGILKLVRRKIVRKRVAVLWLGLVAIELFCPALCETGTNAATPPSRSTASTSIVIDGQDELRTAISGCENDGDHEPVGDCDDECLCHAVAIPSTAGDVRSSLIERTAISLKSNFPIFNSLPPPYIPPKVS